MMGVRRNKLTLLILLFLGVQLGVQAQDPTLEWAVSMGGSSFDVGTSITTDAAGNVYMTGYFAETVDFDPGTGTVNLTSNGDWDIFIQKLDANGNLLWVKQMGGTGYDQGLSITTDTAGNVFATGYFSNTVDFDPGTGIVNLTSNGGLSDSFIQKLDASGNLLWVKQMGGASYVQGKSITTDVEGNVFTIGKFSNTVDFDPGIGIVNLTSIGGWQIFIQKLDASGNLLWVKQMGGTSHDYGNSITTDANGNIYTTGSFEGTIAFNLGPNTVSLTSNGNSDIFIQKLDANGDFLWVKQMGGTGGEEGTSITTDTDGNVCAIGYFSNTVDFDPGTGIVNLTSNGNSDIFIQKLDASGNLLWVKQMGGSSTGRGYSITTDMEGNVYSTGLFTNTVDFDPGAGTVNLTSNGGLSDSFIQKLDVNGNLLWVKQMGGTKQDKGNSITTDAVGNVYTTGYFQLTVDFDPGTGTHNLTSNGNWDIFIQKLGQPISNTTPTLTLAISGQTQCENFVDYTIDLTAVFDDLETTDANLIYTVSGNTNIGVSITHGIATISPSVSWSGTETLTFMVEDEGGLSVTDEVLFTVHSTHTTILDYTLAQGESYIFGTQTITQEGEYTEVFISSNGCDSTVVLTVTEDVSVGVFETIAQQTAIYPNPTNGEFTIDSPIEFDRIKIYNTAGTLVKNDIADLSNLSKGLYIIKLQNNDLTIRKTLIKQ